MIAIGVLQEARNALDDALSSLNTNGKTCECCGLVKREAVEEYRMAAEIRGMIARIDRWMKLAEAR